MHDRRMIIVGGGIIGACFAYAAAQRGVTPLVLSTGSAAGGGTATAASWAWINASSAENEDYFRLRHASLQRWQVWMQRLEGLTFSARESYLWDLPAAELRAAAKQLQSWGYASQIVEAADLKAHLPALRAVPECALHTAIEGAVEPVETAEILLAASGAERLEAHVQGLLCDDGRVTGVMTDDGPLQADEVVLAGGNGSPRLLGTIGVDFPMASTDGLLVRSKPLPAFFPALVAAPDFHARQQSDGRMIVGGTFGPYQRQTGAASLAEDAAGQLRRFGAAFDVPGDLQMDSFIFGTRPIPQGGMPKIGRVPNPEGGQFAGLYLAVMHSGFSNGAGVAHAAMDEILDGGADGLLLPFRLEARAA